MGVARWNPWAELRRRTYIVFARRRLPDGVLGVYGRRGARAAIILNEDLDRTSRNAVLAHELVHDERGGGIHAQGMPAGWVAVEAREELLVEREVARRLVPHDELATFVARQAEIAGYVSVEDVAEEFDVPTSVASVALLALGLSHDLWAARDSNPEPAG